MKHDIKKWLLLFLIIVVLILLSLTVQENPADHTTGTTQSTPLISSQGSLLENSAWITPSDFQPSPLELLANEIFLPSLELLQRSSIVVSNELDGRRIVFTLSNITTEVSRESRIDVLMNEKPIRPCNWIDEESDYYFCYISAENYEKGVISLYIDSNLYLMQDVTIEAPGEGFIVYSCDPLKCSCKYEFIDVNGCVIYDCTNSEGQSYNRIFEACDLD